MPIPTHHQKLTEVRWHREVSNWFGKEKSIDVVGKSLPRSNNSRDPDPLIRKHVTRELADPVLDILAKYKEIEGASTPKVVLDFSTNIDSEEESKSSLGSVQVQEQATPTGQLDPNSLIRKPEYSLEEVVLPPETQDGINQILTLINKRELLVKWGFKTLSGAFVLSGLPGTGKTSTAHAIAHRFDKPLIEASYGDLESRYVGQTSENIRRLFALALDIGAVLFIDEADGALGKRISNVEDSAGQGLNTARNTILVEMEKLVRNDKFKGVVIFATNNAQAFDSAALGRLLSVVPFVLPDESCRSRLFKTHLPEDFPLSDEISYQELAELTDGFNGRDIKNVVQIAAIKTASRDDIPENLYGTMKDFQEAIDLVHQSYNIISDSNFVSGKWMSDRVSELREEENTLNS